MRRNIDYCAEQLEQLVDGTVFGVVKDSKNESFGFQVMKSGLMYTVRIDQDAEGNGPGWVSINWKKVRIS